MKSKQTYQLLEALPLNAADAARLVLEAVEEMPELATAALQGKDELMRALRRVLRVGISAVREQEQTVSFREAAEESLLRRTQAGRRPTTLRDLRHFIRRLLRVPGLAEKPLRSIGTAECRRALHTAFGNSAHSFRKGRTILHSIFAYGIRQQWCSFNPASSVELLPVEEREIKPLPLADCRRLMEVARTPRFHDCLGALALMLFAGVRPGEVARLRWGNLHLLEGVLVIAAHQSKTGGARRVELCPSLLRLLKRLRADDRSLRGSKPICPPRWLNRWQLLRQAAGLASPERRWVPDVLRHTFASYHALTHQNLPALQLQLGHRDARLLLTRYLNLSSLKRGDALSFWNLAA